MSTEESVFFFIMIQFDFPVGMYAHSRSSLFYEFFLIVPQGEKLIKSIK